MQSFVTLLDSSEEHHVETQSTPFVILLSSLTTNIVMRWDSTTKFFVHTSNKSVPTGIQKIQDIFSQPLRYELSKTNQKQRKYETFWPIFQHCDTRHNVLVIG